MRRCSDEQLAIPHALHNWYDERTSDWQVCDGRGRNESMAGQVTVAELRAALELEQDDALVVVRSVDERVVPLALIRERPAGSAVFMLKEWRA